MQIPPDGAGMLHVGNAPLNAASVLPLVIFCAVSFLQITLYLRQKSASLLVPFTWGSREIFYFYPAFFDWAGCDYKEGYVFQILNDKQEVIPATIALSSKKISLSDNAPTCADSRSSFQSNSSSGQK